MIRVALTTDRFETVAPEFTRLGLEAVSMPCIRIAPASSHLLNEAREAALTAELLLITSARTLELLWPDGSMPSAPVAAVGEGTATAVTARGGRVSYVGRSGLGALVEQTAESLSASRVVFPHAAGSDPVALAELREQARGLSEFEVYRSVPVAPSTDRVEAVTFASPSAVEGWLLSRRLDSVVVGVIGPTTGAAVHRHRPPDVMAPTPSHRALARALASYLEVTV